MRVLALLAVVLFFSWVRRPGDFAGYLLVGELVLEGRHIYADAPPGINTWPPFFALFCVPLALLATPGPALARALWLLLNFAALAFVFDLLGRLLYGRPLSLRPAPGRLTLAAPALLVPLVQSFRYVLSNFEHVQINVVVFALALGGLARQARGREWTGGGLLGLAASLKVMPVVFIPYLALRRRWRAAAGATLATAALSAGLPALAFGPARFWEYVGAWRQSVAAGWGVGKMNQSVHAMFDRALGHGLPPFAEGTNVLPESGDPAVLGAVVLAAVAVAAVALAASRGPVAPGGRAALAEWSALFLAAALFAPVMWKAYLIVALLPNALLFAAWRSSGPDSRARRVLGAVLLSAFALGVLTTRSVVGTDLAWRFEMTSTVTWAALILLGGVLWLRARTARGPEAAAAAP
jgi:alpha-1,2-mannosyltransferase